MRARGWALTDVGRKREHNEDSLLCRNELSLYAVADGMGGHLGGERASRMAVEILGREVEEARDAGRLQCRTEAEPAPMRPAAGVLKAAVQRADAAIYEAARSDPDLAGMGTTLTTVLFQDGHLYLCHVGDSRALLYRNGRARQLTEDHSWIQDQVRAGLLSADEAKESRFRNVITRSVGFEPSVEPDTLVLPVEAGDCYVLCSDGLTNHVSGEEIGQILTSCFYAQAPQALIDTANERGGDDNVTCVVVYLANER